MNNFDEINRLVEKLIHLHQESAEKNSSLNDEIGKLTSQLVKKEEQISMLQRNLEVVKLDSGNGTSDEKEELKRKLNMYIVAIDKCLSGMKI
ncbi:MAG: hypothetical protein IPO27_14640 [Bacteroidetes bacterium]|nr:hypothetical protein [Bacteroidota bacterium]